MKNIKNLFLRTVLLALVVPAFIACKRDDDDVAKPVDPNETELITTVKLSIGPVQGRTEEYSYRDLDGDGGNMPIIDTIRLAANAQYLVNVFVLDETKNPVDTISYEIEEERNEHQFFYSKIGTYNLTTTYRDFDDHNVPVGLFVELNTTTGFTEKTNKFRVVLKHQPGLKPTTGNGNKTLGETDIDIAFPILIYEN